MIARYHIAFVTLQFYFRVVKLTWETQHEHKNIFDYVISLYFALSK